MAEEKEKKEVKMSLEDRTNAEIRKLINLKGDNRRLYNKDDFMLISEYTGDTKTQSEISDGYFYDFYTDDEIVKACWQLAFKYGFKPLKSSRILEPSCGVGRFLRYAPFYSEVSAFEIDKTSYLIAKLLYPKFKILNESFESAFFYKVGLEKYDYKASINTYNLVIGNPPYISPYSSVFSKMELSLYPFIKSLEQWFIMRSIDCLERKGLLVFVVPSKIIDNQASYSKFKIELFKKCNMLDSYRLPNNVFKNASITTDIIVLQKK